jgi:dUTP pyrophosphatase
VTRRQQTCDSRVTPFPEGAERIRHRGEHLIRRGAGRSIVATVTEVQIHRLDADVPIPTYAHPFDAGADLVSTIDVTLEPGERTLVPTGVAVALPEGFAGFIHPRSGLALRHGLSVVNTPGTIDAGYRGEVKVLLVNHDLREPVHIARGDRIAQLVVQRVERVTFTEVDALSESVRGAGGYGSSGGHASIEATTEGSL